MNVFLEMVKKCSFAEKFFGAVITALGDTNPSDATVRLFMVKVIAAQMQRHTIFVQIRCPNSEPGRNLKR